jgi:hypothetical protein
MPQTEPPKSFVTQATPIKVVAGYHLGTPIGVYIQEKTGGDKRLMLFKQSNMQGHAGYHVYDSWEEIREDFELGDLVRV